MPSITAEQAIVAMLATLKDCGFNASEVREVLTEFTGEKEEIDRLRAKVVELEKNEESLQFSVDFYKRRCDSLQKLQIGMRDPERQIVCDILANGMLLDGSR